MAGTKRPTNEVTDIDNDLLIGQNAGKIMVAVGKHQVEQALATVLARLCCKQQHPLIVCFPR
jgi:hypothetical protein